MLCSGKIIFRSIGYWLEYQAGLLEAYLQNFLPEGLAPVRSSSCCININYLTDGKDLYLFLVNDNLLHNVETRIYFNKKYAVEDIMTGKANNELSDRTQLEIPPAGIKVLKLK